MYLYYIRIFFYVMSYLRYYINFDMFVYIKICQNSIFFQVKKKRERKEKIFFIHIILTYSYICVVFILFFILHFNYFSVSCSIMPYLLINLLNTLCLIVKKKNLNMLIHKSRKCLIIWWKIELSKDLTNLHIPTPYFMTLSKMSKWENSNFESNYYHHFLSPMEIKIYKLIWKS